MPQHPIAPRDLLFSVARDLIVKGWQPVWCPARQDGGFTPVSNPKTTGYESPFPTVVPQPPGAHRLGFRPPPSMVIIDVDHYGSKRGADTLDRAEEWLGELPPTYKVTSRGYDNPSGRFIYRKPEDLDFTDSALAQFAGDNGKTDIEILRTGHRFSWAPGDINHKNGLSVQCYDPDGEPCLLPDVNDPAVPQLPARWTDYLRNPPQAQSLSAYQRPGDGPQWWLAQPDGSLGSDNELAAFAFDMMLSRVPDAVIFEQWLRVSRNDDPAWPWGRDDYDRHTRSQAQGKVAETLDREDRERAALPATEEQLNDIQAKTREEFESQQKLTALREQRIAEVIQNQQTFSVIPLEESGDWQPESQSPGDYLKALVRGTPEYDRSFRIGLARQQADQDVAFVLARKFSGFRDISRLDDPPLPTMLTVIGKDASPQPLIAPGSITVISGHRSAGKTWAAAKWAEQQITSGSHVAWVDFERQDRGLNSKFRTLGLMPHAVAYHVHYTDELPALPDLLEGLGTFGPYLLVIDAWRGLQARVAPGTSANDGDAVEQVYETYLDPFAKAGGTIALLDHLPKAGMTTFGAERKESAADYVIRVEQVRPFTRKVPGYSTLTLTKDRWGETEKDSVAGYMWMPGDGSETGTGIRSYPKTPEFRNWAPDLQATLEDAAGTSEAARRDLIMTEIVAAEPGRHSVNSLTRTVREAHPDLFGKAESTVKEYVRTLVRDGKLTREQGRADGKLFVPAPEVRSSVPVIDPKQLQHPEELCATRTWMISP